MQAGVCRGLGLVDLRVFEWMHYCFFVVKILKNEGLCAIMIAFSGGWLFRRWGCLGRDSRVPVAFVVSQDYWVLQRFRVEFKLADLGEGERNKIRFKKWLERKGACNFK